MSCTISHQVRGLLTSHSRGRKVYRRFDVDDLDDPPTEDALEGLPEVKDLPPSKRFTRSSIKPRFLFPPNASKAGAPTTARITRTTAKRPMSPSSPAPPSSDVDSPFTVKRAKKNSPFDNWQRTKAEAGSAVPKGRKRNAESPVAEDSSKRQKT